MKLPILRGSLRGRWWLPAAEDGTLRVLLSTYRERHTALFRAMVRPGHTVLDVGAGAGYYTLLAAELAGVTGRVVAFEDDDREAAYLRRHLELNRCVNVTVAEAADAGHLDGYVHQRRLRPDVLRLDVPGRTAEVLGGAGALLERSRPTLFLSTLDPAENASCRRLLDGAGYEMLGIDHDDPAVATDLLAVDALSVPPVPR
jgi:SAM-dependent methyltransferase